MIKAAEDIWITDTLLTPEQCKKVIKTAEESGFQIAHQYETSGRHNHEVFFEIPKIHQTLEYQLSEQIRKCDGEYSYAVIRKKLECYRYRVDEYIERHTDAAVQVSDNIMSNFTLVLYLDDEFKGGKTFFPIQNIGVSPSKGKAVLFNQNLLHEAAPVESGIKYILRAGLALIK